MLFGSDASTLPCVVVCMGPLGIPGSIQVTEATYELIRDRFVCEPRGVISVKGKSDMTTYLLVSRKEDAAITR